MKNVPRLHTKRCSMTGITLYDITNLQEIVEDELFQRFMPELYELVHTIEGLTNFIQTFRTLTQKNDGFLWGVKINNHLIGFVAIMDLTYEPILFYAMHPFHRSKGYTKACVMEVIRFLKKITDKQLKTEVYNDNEASLSLLKDCGFKLTDINDEKSFMLL